MRLLTPSGGWSTVQLNSGLLTDEPVSTVVELVAGPDGALRRHTLTGVYRANPWLWAAVNLIARSIARFPIKVYRDAGESTERIRPGTSSRAATFARALARPGRGRSQQALLHSTAVDRLVHGNAVWFPDRDRSGAYLGFTRVPWRHVSWESIGGEVRYWDARKPSAKRLADDVVHFGAGLDCDELLNPSPIEALRATLALYDAVEQHLVAFFRNSARPSGHLQVDRTTSKPARDLIRAEIQKLYTSPANAGKVLVTSGAWTSMASSPDHSRVIDLAKQSREEIVGVYGVPPPMVGILDRAIMSNVRELRSHLARDVTGSHTVLLEGDIDAQVIARDPLLGDIGVEFEMAAVLRPDLEARAATWKDQRYLLTLNEMRAIENRPRIDHPDADVPWMPLNEAPLGADDAPADQPRPDDDEDDGDALAPQEDP